MSTLNFYSKEKNVGNQIINTNPFFNDLNKLMNNNDFKKMYNTHFKSWSDILRGHRLKYMLLLN